MTAADRIRFENYSDEAKIAFKDAKFDRAKEYLFKAMAIVTICQQEKSLARTRL